jgi:hypothetical protein
MNSGGAMKHSYDIEPAFWFQAGRRRSAASRPLVPVYRVGEPFRRGCRNWPDGAQFTYSPGGHILTLVHSDIDEEMVSEVRQGQAEFALLVELPVIVLAYRFGQSIPWRDAPYSWHLQPAGCRPVPLVDRSPEARALLWITLVGAADGIIHAQRGMTLSPSFTRVLHEAIRAQALMAFDPAECTSVISRVFLSYPSAVDRLALAVARSVGNE